MQTDAPERIFELLYAYVEEQEEIQSNPLVIKAIILEGIREVDLFLVSLCMKLFK
jgi:hypothetical protein